MGKRMKTGAAVALMLASGCMSAWGDTALPIQTVQEGKTAPLGAHYDGRGVNFALYAHDAAAVTLCLFDDKDVEVSRYALNANRDGVWCGYLPDIKPGQRYGYRVAGDYAPDRGWYFNAQKLLLDPYARLVTKPAQFSELLYPYDKNDKSKADSRDSAAVMTKGIVADDDFDWQGDIQLHIPWSDTVIYEVHLKGYSKLNQQVPAALRGTYAGLGSEASIRHLKSLGITSVELLPIYLCLSEPHLDKNGLSNYWGYNPASFFVPDPRFSASGDSRQEFREMVKSLHAAGLEVILDVVYNHSGEQGKNGPMLSWRGIDNRTYYKLDSANEYAYQDYTGCGNSFDLRNDATLQMVIDSLRYWVKEMHVDGFRFDLASVLGREGDNNEYSREAAFFKALAADPDLKDIKLIAEPWDCSAGGYQIGNYPAGWAEWNGEFRDTVRRFWRGDRGQIGALMRKMAGSPDRYAQRSAEASINFVTCHDGFTMNDIVSYNMKHNEINGEDNRDGSNDNFSWNCGQEGPDVGPDIKALRRQQMRNMMMTIALSRGVPMFLGGDEWERTQNGNNNAYCQDNEISYLDWSAGPEASALRDFMSELLTWRREHPSVRSMNYDGLKEGTLSFYDRRGQKLQGSAGDLVGDNCLAMRWLDKERSQQYLLVLNSERCPLSFVLPPTAGRWKVAIQSVPLADQQSESGAESAGPSAQPALPAQTVQNDGKLAGEFTLAPNSAYLLEAPE